MCENNISENTTYKDIFEKTKIYSYLYSEMCIKVQFDTHFDHLS